MAFLSVSYFCLLIFFPLLPSGCLVRIFSSAICDLPLQYVFLSADYSADLISMRLRRPSSIHIGSTGLNCSLFDADFPALPAQRKPRKSCQLTSIPVRSAARTSTHSSRCVTNHFANAQKSSAGCRSGGTAK